MPPPRSNAAGHWTSQHCGLNTSTCHGYGCGALGACKRLGFPRSSDNFDWNPKQATLSRHLLINLQPTSSEERILALENRLLDLDLKYQTLLKSLESRPPNAQTEEPAEKAEPTSSSVVPGGADVSGNDAGRPETKVRLQPSSTVSISVTSSNTLTQPNRLATMGIHESRSSGLTKTPTQGR